MWADTTRFGRWLEVELLATEAHAALGVVPAADAARLPGAGAGDRRRVRRRRRRARAHDRPRRRRVRRRRPGRASGPAGAWIHYGLTSSDVVDTALCWAMRDAADLLLAAADELLAHGRRRSPAATSTR